MSELVQEDGAGHADRKGIFGWMMFDWATQPFHTLIITFVFAPYFVANVAENAVSGQQIWGYATGIWRSGDRRIGADTRRHCGQFRAAEAVDRVLLADWRRRVLDALVLGTWQQQHGHRDHRSGAGADRPGIRGGLQQCDDAGSRAAIPARTSFGFRMGPGLYRRHCLADHRARFHVGIADHRQNAVRDDTGLRPRRIDLCR